MSAISFPQNPNIGEIFTNPNTGSQFQWTGNAWSSYSAPLGISATGPAGSSGTSGFDGVTGPQGIQGEVGPVGPAGLNWRGIWSATGDYLEDDSVGYTGASWFNILGLSGSVSNLPPDQDTVHWSLLASQGSPGQQGPQGLAGTNGTSGSSGSSGSSGLSGVNGTSGSSGSSGTSGSTGATGSAGGFVQTWAISSAYAEGTIVLKDTLFYQANGAIPAGTTFTFGTSGATWKSVGIPQSEFGEVVGGSVPISSSATDLLSFTLPSAGVWEVEYVVRAGGFSINNTWSVSWISNSSNTELVNSEIIIGPQISDSQQTSTGVIRITTSGSEIYKLRARTEYGEGIVYSDGNGKTSVKWKKISEFVPGQVGSSGTSGTSGSAAYRDYAPVTLVENGYWQVKPTSAQITAMGFNAIGGATIETYVNYYGNQFMLRCTATQPTTAAAVYTTPTSYIRHEIAIDPSTDNLYTLAGLCDRNGNIWEVWVCDPSTGVPAKRLCARGAWVGGANYRQKSTTIGPRGQVGYPSSIAWQYYNWGITKSLIDTYKTGSNTIKLAIRSGRGQQEANLFYIGAYGMSTNPYMISACDWGTIGDRIPNDSTTLTATSLAYQGNYNGRYYLEIPANVVKTVLIPIEDETRTYYFGVIGLGGDGHGANHVENTEFTFIGPSSNNYIGCLKNIVPPIAQGPINGSFGYNTMGFVISPSDYVPYLQTANANSAYRYLKVQMFNRGTSQYPSGFVLEAV